MEQDVKAKDVLLVKDKSNSENFKRQINNPTQFEFFRVPAEMFMQAFNTLQQAFQNPDTPENKKTIDRHRVNPEESKQSQAQSTEKSYAIDPGLVQ